MLVTVYVAITVVAPELVNVPVIGDPLPDAPPVKPEPDGEDHEKVVPAGITFGEEALGVTEKALPVHVWVVTLVTLGLGLTVTVIVNVDVH